MPGPAFVRGDPVDLHTVEDEDHDFLREHANDAEMRHWVGITTPLSEADLTGWLDEDDSIHFLACVDGAPVGHVWLFRIRETARRAELGYWIAPEHRGEGYGTAAARLCVGYAFDDLNCHRVMARVYAGNEASRRILDGLGFECEGRLREHGYGTGEYVDAELFGLLEREWRADE